MNEHTDEDCLTRIQGYSHAGEGVGRIRGKPVFIPLAVRGELVRPRVLQEKESYLRGELLEVVEASSARADAPCRLFPRCGGCQLQHQSYDEQLYCKRQRVVSSLQRIGGLQGIEVEAVLGMADPWHYRHTARFHVAWDGQRPVIGFFRSKSRQLLDVGECLLLPAEFPVLLDRIAAFLNRPEPAVRFPVREIVLRKGLATGEFLILFLTGTVPECLDAEGLNRLGSTPSDPAGIDPAGIALMGMNPAGMDAAGIDRVDTGLEGKQAAGINLVGIVCSAAGAKAPHAQWLLAGRDYYRERIGGVMFRVPATAFFQNNPAQAEQLVAVVRSLACPMPGESMVDLYCGVGLFSLTLAPLYRQVWGIEEHRPAAEAAGQNARINNAHNCRFAAGKVERLLPAHRGRVHTLVLNPPRQGCSPGALKAIASLSPGKIIYVSCDPATLARDLFVLIGHGYRVRTVQPVDMFPQTYHVETVALLERSS